MPHTKPWHICALAAVTAVTLVAFVPAATGASPADDYVKERPYGNPKDTLIRSAPDGYRVFFLETIGRHGARSMVNNDTEQRALALWASAERKNALTDNGKSLAGDIAKFQAAERKIGYGRLSGLGRQEMAGIGRRTADSYASFFAYIRREAMTISTVTSDYTRTKQSASSLVSGLEDGVGKSLDNVLAKPFAAYELLRFDSSTSKAGQAIVDKVRGRTDVREHAEHVLRASYKGSFVDSIDDPVSAALDLYKMYITAPGMQKETKVTFARYVPKEDRDTLSYVSDVVTFYRYGPGVKGETNTFKNARPLLKDFFDHLDQRITDEKKAAIFHVAHGETTMPFAALIKAPGSEKQTPKGEVFSRSKNPWRSAVAGRLSGNIEWTALRNDDRKVLVTMRYNEKPVPFHSGCTPYKKNSLFYRVSELKECLG